MSNNAPPPLSSSTTATTLMNNALQTSTNHTNTNNSNNSNNSSHHRSDRHRSKHAHHTTHTHSSSSTTKHHPSSSTTNDNDDDDQPRRKHDVDRIRKKFRDAIYVGNFERVARIIKNIIENDTLDLSSVLLPYASRHVTPIGLAARRGHVKICKILVEVLKDYVVKQHAGAHAHKHAAEEQPQPPPPVNGQVLHLFLPPPPPTAVTANASACKEEEEYTFDHEVEENANEDESSSEHNNTNNASISPQPYTQPAAAPANGVATGNGNGNFMLAGIDIDVAKNTNMATVTQTQTSNSSKHQKPKSSPQDGDVDVDVAIEEKQNAHRSKPSMEFDNYVLDDDDVDDDDKQHDQKKTKSNTKSKSKQWLHLMRSSSSGALLEEKQVQMDNNGDREVVVLPLVDVDTEEKMSALQLNHGVSASTNSGESSSSRKHRKTRSLPYIQLHSMLNRLDGENRTALSHACEKGQIEVIEFLLSEPGIAIESGGKHHEESWTNLHWACRYGHHQIVQLLLHHRADINAQTSKKKSTGLHLACATGHTEVIHVLLQNGAAKEIEDVYGCSPLSLAIHFGEKKVQQILYEAGIDVSPHDARRLKKDNHIFRRFGWIKIPPSISSTIVLPDDVWCVVCGFLPCDELLLNVRLVSFGFLYVVHHPALRKLVNFKRSLPDKSEELVQYNEGHQTLVLKAPNVDIGFNAIQFIPPPMLGFAPPPPAAAILGLGHVPVALGPPLHHHHPHMAHMHGHGHASLGGLGMPPLHNPFGAFPPFPGFGAPPPTLQSMYDRHHAPTTRVPLPAHDSSHNATNDTSTATARSTRHDQFSARTRERDRPHSMTDYTFQALEFDPYVSEFERRSNILNHENENHRSNERERENGDDDEHENADENDEFTPPPPVSLQRAHSHQHQVQQQQPTSMSSAGPMFFSNYAEHMQLTDNDLIELLNQTDANLRAEDLQQQHGHVNLARSSIDMNRPPTTLTATTTVCDDTNVNLNDHDNNETVIVASDDSDSLPVLAQDRNLQGLNGELASLIFDSVHATNGDEQPQQPTSTQSQSEPQMRRQLQPQLPQGPQPSDISAEQLKELISGDVLQMRNLLPSSSSTPDESQSQPQQQQQSQSSGMLMQLSTIHSNVLQPASHNALPPSAVSPAAAQTEDSTSAHAPQASLSLNEPPLLSRNYSHNNFVQHNSDLQRLLCLSPPMSPSLHDSTKQQSNVSNDSTEVVQVANIVPVPSRVEAAQVTQSDANGDANDNAMDVDMPAVDDLDGNDEAMDAAMEDRTNPTDVLWTNATDMMALNNPMLNHASMDNLDQLMFAATANTHRHRPHHHAATSDDVHSFMSHRTHPHHQPLLRPDFYPTSSTAAVAQSHHLHHHLHRRNDTDFRDIENDDETDLFRDLMDAKNESPDVRDTQAGKKKKSDPKRSWQYKHCQWLACAVNFGPSNLRKIRLTGSGILTQPLIRVLSCLSFIVHLELAHFHAYRLTTMDLAQLSRVSQLKMIRQLKVFPVIRNNSYRAARYDACAVATFITQIGSTALTLGIKYESVEIDIDEQESIRASMRRYDAMYAKALKSKKQKSALDQSQAPVKLYEEDCIADLDTANVDMMQLSSLTWKSLFDHLPSNLRSLRLHFGKDDSLKSGAVHGLKNFESIKCFTLHGDPGLYGQIPEWSNVFQRWNKLRYIVLGHRNNTKELQVPKEILEALPPMLPELALNISVHSIPNVVWYLKHVVQAECFLRINLHVVHKHKTDLYNASIHSEIIPCLTRFHNLETAYLKCGMVTLKQIKLLLHHCTKVSFVGFGIDASDEQQVVAFRILLEEYGFDKIVVKNKLNWLIAVKSYDKLLLDPTRCIHPVLEAFDDKSCQIMSSMKHKPKQKTVDLETNSSIQPL